MLAVPGIRETDGEGIPGTQVLAPEEREILARCKAPKGRRGTGFKSHNDCAPEAGRENRYWPTVRVIRYPKPGAA
jgi:hypothetical protein